jgi:hypothetical protein
VVPNADGSYKAVFGYDSLSFLGGQTSIPVGSGNTFGPAPANRGQRRRSRRAPDGAVLGPVRRQGPDLDPRRARRHGQRAAPELRRRLRPAPVDPTKPRIDKPLATGAAPLSVDESIAIRTSFRWTTRCRCRRRSPTARPGIYYALIFLSSPNTLQTLDALRIHYANHRCSKTRWWRSRAQGDRGRVLVPARRKGQFVYALIPGRGLERGPRRRAESR